METIGEAAEALRTYVHERERAKVLGTVSADLGDLTEVADALDGIAMAEGDEDEDDFAEAFEGLRWPKMSQAERRDILVRLKKWSDTTDDQPRSLAIEAVIEALQRVCETEGVL